MEVRIGRFEPDVLPAGMTQVDAGQRGAAATTAVATGCHSHNDKVRRMRGWGQDDGRSLLASIHIVVRSLNRQIWLHREQVCEGGALVVRELTLETFRIQNALPLRVGHFAKVAEGSSNQAPAIDREAAVLLHGLPNLLALRLTEVFHRLVALKDPVALLVRHVVKLSKTIKHALLRLLRKLAKARLLL